MEFLCLSEVETKCNHCSTHNNLTMKALVYTLYLVYVYEPWGLSLNLDQSFDILLLFLKTDVRYRKLKRYLSQLYTINWFKSNWVFMYTHTHFTQKLRIVGGKY